MAIPLTPFFERWEADWGTKGETTSSCSIMGMGRGTGYVWVLFHHLKHRLNSVNRC